MIAIDCDGVLADFIGGVLAALKADGDKRNLNHQDVTTWDMAACLGIPKRKFYDIVTRKGFCLKLDPIEGARESLSRLRQLDDVVCVTSPWSGDYWPYERTEWLRHMMDFQYRDIIHCSQKEIIRADILIEDKLSTAIDWAEANPEGTAVVLAYAHNHLPQPCPANIKRVESWSDLVSVCQELRGSR